MSKTTVNFVINAERVKLEIEWKDTPKGRELSICGNLAGSAGQNTDSIRELGEAADDARVIRVCNIWDRWHLNGMKAGTPAQEDELRDHTFPGHPMSHLDWARGVLKAADLEPDNGYSYGSAWLFEPVPDEVAAELAELCGELQGAIIGDAPDVDDAPDVSETDDVIDSRDVIKRLEIYEAAVRALGLDPDTGLESIDFDSDYPNNPEAEEIWREYKALKELDEEASGYAADWSYGEQLINADHFEDYAEQLAEDIGALDRNATWPKNHIDWAAAAEELKQDYTTITFKGKDFYVR